MSLSDGGGREKAQLTEVHQVVTLEREDAYPVLFGAAPVSKVKWINSETEAVMSNAMRWSPDRWELQWNEALPYPKTYSITSAVVTLDEQGLRTAKAVLPAGLSQYYLGLPAELPDRVRELAEDISADGTTDYDRAKLIETYLRQNYIYNNKPDLSKLSGNTTDFVDGFLFELQEGYCDYFSTAMAVMARSIGLPSRWVKGFTPGSLPVDRYGPPGESMLDGERYNPTGAGTYTVRNSDAHSWVEIYFEGFGWIPFEPTSGFRFPYVSPEGEELDLTLPEADQSETPEAAVKTTSAPSRVWGIVSLIVLVIAAAAWLIVKRRQMATAWFKIRHGNLNTNEQIVMEANRLIRFCKKRGMKREEHETLREAVARWSQSQRRLQEDFRAVLDGFEKAKYGQTGATREEVERYTNKVRYLIGELK